MYDTKPERLAGPLIAVDLPIVSTVRAVKCDGLDWQPNCLVGAGIGYWRQIVLCMQQQHHQPPALTDHKPLPTLMTLPTLLAADIMTQLPAL